MAHQCAVSGIMVCIEVVWACDRTILTASMAQWSQRSTTYRPHRKPMPVGPHILWLEATIQSQPRVVTSTGMWGTLWQQSPTTNAPTCVDHMKKRGGNIEATLCALPITTLQAAVSHVDYVSKHTHPHTYVFTTNFQAHAMRTVSTPFQ